VSEVNQTSDIHMMLGEMRGQMREVVHGMNNASQKIDALTREAIEIKGITATVAAMEIRLLAVEGKVATLTTDKDRRAGALSLGEWVIKIVPMAALGAAFALVAKFLGVVP
jgi:hypothetical protein